MNVTSAKLEAPALNCSAQPLPSKASGYVRRMAGEAPALNPKQAENAVLKLNLSMDVRPARRESNAA